MRQRLISLVPCEVPSPAASGYAMHEPRGLGGTVAQIDRRELAVNDHNGSMFSIRVKEEDQ